MAIKVLRSAYDQVTVINLKIDVEIKKFSGGTFQGWQLNYEDKDGELRSSKFNSGWLNLKWQDALRSQLEVLKAGDEITLVKEKTCDEAKWEGSSEEEREKLGFWGVKSLEMGHVVPTSHNAPAPAPAFVKRDSLPIELGNCLTIANALKGDLTSRELVGLAVKDVREVQVRLQETLAKEYASMDDYSRGARLGQSLILAAERTTLDGLYDEALALFGLICKGEEFLRGTPAVEPVAVVEPVVEAPVVEAPEPARAVKEVKQVEEAVEADLPW